MSASVIALDPVTARDAIERAGKLGGLGWALVVVVCIGLGFMVKPAVDARFFEIPDLLWWPVWTIFCGAVAILLIQL